jgi:hypothetical protein
MKPRILNFGVSGIHDRITVLSHIENAVSISDFDSFVFDPASLGGQQFRRETYERRRNELRELINQKNGVIVCILRPDLKMVVSELGGTTPYSLFDYAAPRSVGLVRTKIRAGEGSQWKLVPNVKSASNGYFRVLQGKLLFEAFLEMPDAEVGAAGGIVIALNSVGYPVAVEFLVGAGRLCFVPIPRDVPGDRVGAAILRVVEAHFGGPGEIEVPPWANEIEVPGADENDGRIAELGQTKSTIEIEISELTRKRSELLNFRQLLFGYGRTVLEPVVRDAFRRFGFTVLGPDEYEGEWDVDISEPVSGRTAIGEVEGSEGVINVDKYRQLLDYFQAEVLEGRVRKGILIGNGYRLKELSEPDRQNQFTEQALRGGRQNGFCLLPTTELFKAVCAVLESPQDEALKFEIRNSLLLTVGIWTFARTSAVLAKPGPSAEPT